MSRADECYEGYHGHVGVCQRAGYRNGLLDGQDKIAAELEALINGPVDGDRVARFTQSPIPNVGVGSKTSTWVSVDALRALLRVSA